MSNIATRLKCALGDTGISQKELSRMTGITEAAISRYVNGNRVPKVTTLAQIAGALGVGLGYFFDSVAKDTNVLSNDLIGRRVAIEALRKGLPGGCSGKAEYIIEQLTAAQPQRVRGRWEVYQLAELGRAWTVQCSACHAIGFHGKTPYCPECGAQMMEGEE